MRIKEMADLAGTTPRTVRHYHSLGLLPVPAKHGLQRDYGVEHLARLMRIRWLADSGMSLERIGHLLGTEPPTKANSEPAVASSIDTLEDLEATRAEIAARIDILTHQKHRVEQMIARVRAGDALSALPAELERFFDDIERRLTREGTQRYLANKKTLGVLLATTGIIPAGIFTLFLDNFDEEQRVLYAQLMDRFDELAELNMDAPNNSADPAPAEIIKTIEDDCWTMIQRHRVAAAQLLRTLPGGALTRPIWRAYSALIRVAFPHPAQRAVIDGLFRRGASDPVLGPAIDDSLRKEWTSDVSSD